MKRVPPDLVEVSPLRRTSLHEGVQVAIDHACIHRMGTWRIIAPDRDEQRLAVSAAVDQLTAGGGQRGRSGFELVPGGPSVASPRG